MQDAARGAGHPLAAACDNSTAAAGLRLRASTRAPTRVRPDSSVFFFRSILSLTYLTLPRCWKIRRLRLLRRLAPARISKSP